MRWSGGVVKLGFWFARTVSPLPLSVFIHMLGTIPPTPVLGNRVGATAIVGALALGLTGDTIVCLPCVILIQMLMAESLTPTLSDRVGAIAISAFTLILTCSTIVCVPLPQVLQMLVAVNPALNDRVGAANALTLSFFVNHAFALVCIFALPTLLADSNLVPSSNLLFFAV